MPSSIFASSESPVRVLPPPMQPQHAIDSRPNSLPAPAAKPGAALSALAQGLQLATLEHTRVSISAQSVRGERESSYSLEASLTYSRLATGPANVPKEPAAAPVSIPADDVPDAATQAATNPAPTNEAAAADEAGQGVAQRNVFSFYEHVLFNATSTFFSVQSRHDSLPHSALMAAQAPAAGGPTTPATLEGTVDARAQGIARFAAENYAESFTKLRMRGSEQRTETALSLKLTTREGDKVELDFRQVEMLSRMRLKGVAENGDRVRANESNSSLERAVQMNVQGDISAAEMDAINALLDDVTAVASKFFSGDMRAAWDRLMSMEFSSDELTDFSLRMSVAQTTQVSRAYQGEDGLASFVTRDKQSLDVLEFLAGQQRSLIESAQKHFDDASAVTLVRELLPRMLPDAHAPESQTVDEPAEATAEPVLA